MLLQLPDGPDAGNEKQLRCVDGARAKDHLPPYVDSPDGAIFINYFNAADLVVLEKYLFSSRQKERGREREGETKVDIMSKSLKYQEG